MAETSVASFGKLLRQFRRDAELTQEELAERAGLSTRAVSDLERGVKQAPHEATIDMLADALELSVDDREALRRTVSRRRRLPASREPARRRLPAEPTPFVGREREEGEVRRLLRWGELRLLTLTGPGGVGKTRLALRVAGAMADEFADGVAFVSLAAADGPERAIALIAQELDLKEQPSRPMIDTVADYLASREILLVLDNFEHVMAAASAVAELLARAPRLRILTTSREPLHLRSEQELDVPPLEVPEAVIRSSGRSLLRYPALALFMERARAVRPDFQAGDAEAGIIAEICRRLDGLPLAIELAAPRIKVTGLEGLLQQVEFRLMVLTDGPRDLPLRQQTMWNTIQWSYDLLGDDEQAAFRRLAVVVDGFDAETAVAVLPSGRPSPGNLEVRAGRRLERPESKGSQAATAAVADRRQRERVDRLLVSLAEKNLLRRDPNATARFRMLETVREYGLDVLAGSGELPAARRAHAEHFAELARMADSARKGPDQPDWTARVERSYDDLRSALRFYRDSGELDRALQLAGDISWFWEMRGLVQEGEAWTEELLNAAGSGVTASAVG
ncbi:MAG TPA: helix-turn-helix domain-containing protein, partial [Chloroflexota bacterium]|nr:helix-turn-helix domain-containing protein [Chloroflexota bacterium]